jgi:glyoxylate reductase
MPGPKVYITRRIFPEALEALKAEGIEFEMNEGPQLTKAEIRAKLREKEWDGLICLLTDRIDQEVLEAGPYLKVVANVAVGYDNIDLAAATARGVMVTNTPGVLTETTADLTFALILSVARRIVEADRFVRAGKFSGWELLQPHLGTDVYGKTLGIVGFGRIGQAVARRAHGGFNMKVLYYDEVRNEEAERELAAEFVPFEELLKRSDFISIHVPLTEKTHHMLDAAAFRRMKKGAYLINTARGPVVDEEALVKALKAGKLAGAGLDVYEKEPRVHPELLKLNNVVLLPHIGSATTETRLKMALMAVENLLAALRGQVPPNLVNQEVLSR